MPTSIPVYGRIKGGQRRSRLFGIQEEKWLKKEHYCWWQRHTFGCHYHES
jgi:hypothetical protein